MRSLRKFIVLSTAIIALSIININAQNAGALRQSNGRTLEHQIYKKILNLTEYGVFDYITFRIDGGTVTLEGKVASFGTKNDAPKAVKDLPGVTNVVNNIEQLPASSFDDQIRREALGSFTRGGPAQYFQTPRPDVRIIVENGRMTLEGYVYSSADSNMLNVLAHGISGVFSVQNNLIVGKDVNR